MGLSTILPSPISTPRKRKPLAEVDGNVTKRVRFDIASDSRNSEDDEFENEDHDAEALDYEKYSWLSQFYEDNEDLTGTNDTKSTVSPRWLFRAGSERSRGCNTKDEIDPLFGTDFDYHKSVEEMFERNAPTLVYMLYWHVRWNYKKTHSEFSSWSSSLLFVLVHAVRRAFHDKNKHVLIYVLDTSKLDKGRVYRAVNLLGFYQVALPKPRNLDEAEYLIHGRLTNQDGLWQAVPLAELVKAGLCREVYEEDEAGKVKDGRNYAFATINKPAGLKYLIRRVKQLRDGYFKDDRAFNMKAYLSPMKKIAKCFGEGWEGIMLIALLASRSRTYDKANLAMLMSAIDETKWVPTPTVAEEEVFEGDVECVETCHFVRWLKLATYYKQILWDLH